MDYGGCSPVEAAVGWCNAVACMDPTTDNVISTTLGSVGKCHGRGAFDAHDPGIRNPARLDTTNISTDAKYRGVQLANTMRAQGVTVYSIGLGDKIDQTYLLEMANDPASPTYDPTQPSGLAEFAPTSSQLDTAFRTIASKILLRLTQ